ncbi:hypothetical protein HJFPF1_05291 [Paramyrothecium foliicola]|nr:hypothetical protein HJFPF1_05291 [Paramyrothecium foliicola]
MPRYAILIKATSTSEGKGKPSADTLAAVAKFNEEMHVAGVLLGGEGLRPTSEGYRVKFSAAQEEVEIIPGPLDLQQQSTISGWWIIKAESGEDALRWAKKIPFRGTQNAEVEIRRISTPEDFEMTDDLKKREEVLRAEIEGK